MYECHCGDWFNQILLLLFVAVLLFGLFGLNPDLVLRAAASIATTIIEGIFKLLQWLLAILTKARKK